MSPCSRFSVNSPDPSVTPGYGCTSEPVLYAMVTFSSGIGAPRSSLRVAVMLKASPGPTLSGALREMLVLATTLVSEFTLKSLLSRAYPTRTSPSSWLAGTT